MNIVAGNDACAGVCVMVSHTSRHRHRTGCDYLSARYLRALLLSWTTAAESLNAFSRQASCAHTVGSCSAAAATWLQLASLHDMLCSAVTAKLRSCSLTATTGHHTTLRVRDSCCRERQCVATLRQHGSVHHAMQIAPSCTLILVTFRELFVRSRRFHFLEVGT